MSVRLPDPIANTTTEAYLAYKAGVLAVGELKPSLYEPHLHFDAWLAYWTGLVNTYPTKEGGEPEMLTDEEALVAYLAGVTDTYPEEIKDPYDVRIVGYLKYLVSVRWGRPEEILNNQELYLSMLNPAVVSSGTTPVTEATLENTAEAPFADIKLYGDTTQQTYSGKNLCDYVSMQTNYVSGYFETTSTTILSGALNRNRIGYIPCSKNTAYTVGCIVNTEIVAGIWVAFTSVVPDVGVAISNPINIGSAPKTVTSSSDAEYMIIRIQSSVGVEIADVWSTVMQDIKLQIETGSTATSYEPYTGGYASPSPMYPQEVRTVTGRQVVEVSGPNLFNYLDTISVGPAITTDEDGWITCSFDNSSGSGMVYQNYFTRNLKLDTDSTYKLVAEVQNVTGTGYVYFSSTNPGSQSASGLGYDFSNLYDGRIIVANLNTKASFDSPGAGIRTYLKFDAGTSGSIKFRLSVLKDVTVTQDSFVYQKYSNNSFEINLGKNLLNIPDATASNKGLTITFSGGVATMSGEYSGSPTNIVFPVSIPIKAGTYTLSDNTSVNNYPYVALKNSSGAIVTTTYGERVKTVTVEEDTVITELNMYFGATREYDGATFKPQLELGSEATEFQPYFTPIELCKIGNKQDYIYQNNGEWYLHREVRHYRAAIADMNNSANYPGWRPSAQIKTDIGEYNGGIGYKTQYVANIASSAPASGNVYSVSINTTNTGGDGVIFLARTYFNPTYGGDWTQDYWKTTFPNLVFDLYYGILNLPDDELITNNALVAQLNALKEGGSLQGTTNIKISATDPNLPAGLIVEAYKYD